MLLRKICLLLIWAFLATVACAQKVNNVWVFGDHAGLDFNADPPHYLDSTQINGETPPFYASSICANDGQLLFYTDGYKVWNRRHQPLRKFMNRWPWEGKMIPLFCPYPGNDSLYYLFGVADTGRNSHRLQYLTINKKGDNGWGAVVYPQPATTTNYFTPLLAGASILLAGTTHCNGKDTWIVTYAFGHFFSFLVSERGVSTTPVISDVPLDIVDTPRIDGGYSNLKFSANGARMLLPLVAENKVAVFDFDTRTGTFSGGLKLGMPPNHTLEDAELSPDGTKLYWGAYAPEIRPREPYPNLHYIFQMDLNAGTAAAIEATFTQLNPVGDRAVCGRRVCFFIYRTLQLAPDGRILVSMRYSDSAKLDLTASVIENPNAAGNASFYRKNVVNLKRRYRFINYSYIRSQSFSIKENGIIVQKKNCADRPVAFALLYSKVDSVRWDFGDPASGSRNASLELTPQHVYPGPGTYSVSAILYTPCRVDTAVQQVVVAPDRAVQVPAFIRDTAICVGTVLELDASVPGATTYTWDNGLIYSRRTMDTAGRYSVTIANDCSMDRREFKMVYQNCPCEVFVPTAFTPNNDGLNDLFRPVVKCAAHDYRLVLFNRYGNLCFDSTDPQRGWNGKSAKGDAPAGVYIWNVQYRDPNTKEVIFKKGTVLLMR